MNKFTQLALIISWILLAWSWICSGLREDKRKKDLLYHIERVIQAEIDIRLSSCENSLVELEDKISKIKDLPYENLESRVEEYLKIVYENDSKIKNLTAKVDCLFNKDSRVNLFTQQDIQRITHSFQEPLQKIEHKGVKNWAKAIEQEREIILAIKIELFKYLSARARNCLLNDGIYTIGSLIKNTRKELLKIPKLGLTTLKEIEDKLGDLGLKLKEGKTHD